MKLYTPVEVTVADSQREKLRGQIDRKYLPVKIVVKGAGGPTHTLLLTQGQIAKIEKARELGRRRYKTIRMSRKQIEKNQNHYQGGFLRLVDDISPEVTKVPEFENVKVDDNDGIYLVKHGHTMKILPINENGLHLQEHPLDLHERFKDGLYLKHGNVIENAESVVLDEKSPKIPMLQWIL